MAAKSSTDKRLFEFGGFLLDATSRTLRSKGELVVLPPLVFDTLILLLEHRGEILTKQEMLDAIWPDSFVEEGNLTQNIYLLRRTLGKDAGGRDWIETMPRKGYIFSGEVRVVNSSGVATNPTSQDLLADVRHPARRNRTGVIAIAVFIAVLTGAAGFWAYSRSSHSGDTAQARNVEFKKLTFSGDVEFPVIAPDGRSFAFSLNGRLIIQSLDDGKRREIELPDKMEAGFLQFTPDGKLIAFRNQRQVFLGGDVFTVPVGGGEPSKLLENVWSGVGFSSDGTQVAFIREFPDQNAHRLMIRDIVNGTERQLAEFVGPTRFVLLRSPAWSPDGSKIATTVLNHETGYPRSELDIYDVDTGDREQIAPRTIKAFEQAVWLPGGDRIAVIAREADKFFQVWALSYPGGNMTHISNDLNIYRGLSISANGRKLLATNYTSYSHVWLADAANLKDQHQVTSGNLSRDGTLGMQWLSDGTLVYPSRIFGNVDLYRIGEVESQKIQLTNEAGDINGYPELSIDGKTIYFTSTRTGNTQIWKMDAATGGAQTQLTFGEKEISQYPQASADGHWLYFIKKSKSETAIWKRLLDGGGDVKLDLGISLPPDNFIAISPDGKYIATTIAGQESGETQENEHYRVAVISLESNKIEFVFELPTKWVEWLPDQNALDYVEHNNGTARVWRQTLDGSAPKLLFEEKGAYIAQLAWNASGTRLAISKGKRLNDAVLITNF